MIGFDIEEEEANKNLLKVMQQIQDWDLNCNQIELISYVHGLQLFIIKHMLQRYDAIGFCEWYGNGEN